MVANNNMYLHWSHWSSGNAALQASICSQVVQCCGPWLGNIEMIWPLGKTNWGTLAYRLVGLLFCLLSKIVKIADRSTKHLYISQHSS